MTNKTPVYIVDGEKVDPNGKPVGAKAEQTADQKRIADLEAQLKALQNPAKPDDKTTVKTDGK